MKEKKEIILKGLPISEGIVCATVCLLDNDRHTQSSCTRILPENVEPEKKRLASAIEQVSLKFDNLQKQVILKIGKGEAEIFSALKFMLTDPTVTEKLYTAIEKNLCSAESAVFLVFDKFIEQFKSIDDRYIKERATDITDIKQHLINELANKMHALTNYSSLNEEMSINGKKEAYQFSWDEPARKCVDVYQNTLFRAGI